MPRGRSGGSQRKGLLPFWHVTWTGVFVVSIIIIFGLIPVVLPMERFMNTFFFIMCMIVVAASFRLLFMTGMMSVAQGTFMIVGGYTSAILCTRYGFNMWTAFPLSILIPMIISLPIGIACLRLGGFYLLIITGGLSTVFQLATVAFQGFLGGTSGYPTGASGLPADVSRVPSMPSISLFGRTIEFNVARGSGMQNFYYVTLIFLVICLLVLWRMEAGRLVYKTDHSIRQNKKLATSVGVFTAKYKLWNFVLSCGFAGAVGAFLAHFYTYIDPLTHTSGMNFLRYVIIGGRDSFAGPIVGSIFLPFITEYFRAFRRWNTIILSLVLILFIIYIPGGLMSIPDRLRRRFGKSQRKTFIPPQWI